MTHTCNYLLHRIAGKLTVRAQPRHAPYANQSISEMETLLFWGTEARGHRELRQVETQTITRQTNVAPRSPRVTSHERLEEIHRGLKGVYGKKIPDLIHLDDSPSIRWRPSCFYYAGVRSPQSGRDGHTKARSMSAIIANHLREWL